MIRMSQTSCKLMYRVWLDSMNAFPGLFLELQGPIQKQILSNAVACLSNSYLIDPGKSFLLGLGYPW